MNFAFIFIASPFNIPEIFLVVDTSGLQTCGVLPHRKRNYTFEPLKTFRDQRLNWGCKQTVKVFVWYKKDTESTLESEGRFQYWGDSHDSGVILPASHWWRELKDVESFGRLLRRNWRGPNSKFSSRAESINRPFTISDPNICHSSRIMAFQMKISSILLK